MKKTKEIKEMKKMEKQLTEIKYLCKSMSRNLYRICNLGLITMAVKLIREAKEKGETKIANVGTGCLFVLVIQQVMMTVLDIKDLFEYEEE
ncbi:MAG: hypothetical protein Q4B70_14320 [Lachnospiraceae bacterium]|nr:hypothetical protein [Lachnospiraceae bacterium]